MRLTLISRRSSFIHLLLVAGVIVAGSPSGIYGDCDGLSAAASPEGCCCVGMVGNVDCDYTDGVDIMDLTRLIDFLFISYTPLMNLEEANVYGLPGLISVI